MSRPKPKVLLEVIAPNFKSEQIVQANAIYAVFYRGKPCNIRILNKISHFGTKYRRVSFSNQGSAVNLAEKLNKLYSTDDFEVFALTVGTKIEK